MIYVRQKHSLTHLEDSTVTFHDHVIVLHRAFFDFGIYLFGKRKRVNTIARLPFLKEQFLAEEKRDMENLYGESNFTLRSGIMSVDIDDP